MKRDLNPDGRLIFRVADLPGWLAVTGQCRGLIEMESENKRVVNKR